MKKLVTLTFDHADPTSIVDIWQDEEGKIILGGFGWFEHYQYEKIKATEKKEAVKKP